MSSVSFHLSTKCGNLQGNRWSSWEKETVGTRLDGARGIKLMEERKREIRRLTQKSNDQIQMSPTPYLKGSIMQISRHSCSLNSGFPYAILHIVDGKLTLWYLEFKIFEGKFFLISALFYQHQLNMTLNCKYKHSLFFFCFFCMCDKIFQ